MSHYNTGDRSWAEYTRLLSRYGGRRFKQKIIGPEVIFCWQNTGNLYIHLHRGVLNGARDNWDDLPTGETPSTGGS
jgi:hypothetical protein